MSAFTKQQLGRGGPRIERQGTLEQGDRAPRRCRAIGGFEPCGASPENVVQRVGIGGRPGGLRADQREIERDSDAAGDLVLQGKQIADVALEPLGPQMRAGLGIDQLGVDADLLGRALDAAFKHIAHAQLAADLLGVDRLALVGERGIARNHEAARDPRQIGRQILGDAVGKILLLGVVAQIVEGQHHDRQARRCRWRRRSRYLFERRRGRSGALAMATSTTFRRR